MSIESTLVLTPEEYAAKQATYYSLPPGQQVGNLTIQQFHSLLYHMLDIEKPGLIIAPAFPKYLIPDTPAHQRTMENPTEKFMDTITYKVTREEPGSIGGNKQPFGGTRELTPNIRQIVKGPDKSENIYGQWFDTLVQFDTWSLSNWEADILVLWFKRYMTTHRNFLKHMGLSEIHFWWRGVDETSSKLNNGLHLRTIVYFVRTEEICTESDFNLKELQFQIENKNV